MIAINNSYPIIWGNFVKKAVMNRRQVIKLGAAGLVALPLVNFAVAAESGDKVDESSDIAKQLHYKHNSKKAEGYVKGQSCKGCAFYQGEASTKSGGCIVFGGKQVAAKGWCTSFRYG